MGSEQPPANKQTNKKHISPPGLHDMQLVVSFAQNTADPFLHVSHPIKCEQSSPFGAHLESAALVLTCRPPVPVRAPKSSKKHHATDNKTVSLVSDYWPTCAATKCSKRQITGSECVAGCTERTARRKQLLIICGQLHNSVHLTVTQ
jgi:hypothetical protein